MFFLGKNLFGENIRNFLRAGFFAFLDQEPQIGYDFLFFKKYQRFIFFRLGAEI